MNLLELAEKLVAFDTVSKKTTLPMAAFASQYLQDLGFEIEEYPYKTEGVCKVNLIARKGGSDSRLVLAGHMDTVPAGSEWKSNAWTLTRKDNVFCGLGIADMKFFLAVAMKASEEFRSAKLHHPFALCFTSDEEVGCLGAKKLVDAVRARGRKIGDYVVIGEPTQSQPIFAHKGYIYLEVSVEALQDEHSREGKKDNSAHSSDPRKTTNAVEKTMTVVMEELRKFKERIEQISDPRFDPDYPTMNIGGNIIIGRRPKPEKEGKVEAGSEKEEKVQKLILDKFSKNIIPRGYTIESDIRFVPGQDPEELIHILKVNITDRIARIKTTVLNEDFRVTVRGKRRAGYPMETPRTSRIVTLAEEISGSAAGTTPYNTEGHIFNKAGSQTLIWGPTDIGQAHNDNEYVPAELFDEKTIQPYVRLIRAMCVEGGE
jgi:acetylornithine deacetylase